jgi:FMN-dependent NADH-azoreductase
MVSSGQMLLAIFLQIWRTRMKNDIIEYRDLVDLSITRVDELKWRKYLMTKILNMKGMVYR